MALESVFKISLYSLIAIGGVILGVAEGEGMITGLLPTRLLLPFLSIPVVIIGYLVTERSRFEPQKKGTGLSSLWANLLGLAALGATFYEFFGENHEAKLLAGSHLLLYTTWIVLIQQKTIRLYWFLLALGILQLAVASVLTKQGWFGFAAMFYMFAAVWTLSVFSLWRAEQQFEGPGSSSEPKAEKSKAAIAQPSPWKKLQSLVRGGVRHESGTRWLTFPFVVGVMFTSCGALLVSVAFFAFVPRVWLLPEFSLREEIKSFSNANGKQGLVTTVKLGDVAATTDSLEKVFEIRIVDAKMGTHISVEDYAERLGMAEPLFRGAVLTHYESGRWSADSSRSAPSDIPSGRMRDGFVPSSTTQFVRQEIHMEPNVSRVLYSLGRPMALSRLRPPPTSRRGGPQRPRTLPRYASYDEFTGVCLRSELPDLEYQVWTILPEMQQEHFKLKITDPEKLDTMRTRYMKTAMEVPKSLTRLKSFTGELIERETARKNAMERRSEKRELSSLEIASAIEAYLRDSGIYKYARETLVKDSKVDPVEDFLFNRKEGHCEYFATALALMIRAAGIPARVVSGYKGGHPSPDKEGMYEIQQRYSHVWVEAWADKDGWTTFDATPVDSRAESLAQIEAKKASVWSDMQATLSSLWSENVLKMSLDHQEESIYKPMRELAYAVWTIIKEFFVSPTAAWHNFLLLVSNQEQWLSLGGAIFGSLIIVGIFLPIWLLRKPLAALIADWRRYLFPPTTRRKKIISFYQRFMKITGARGLNRPSDQTQQEFADHVAEACRPELTAAGLSDVPDQISRLFYRVRFGDDELSVEDLDRLDSLLDQFEQAMKTEPNSRKHHKNGAVHQPKIST